MLRLFQWAVVGLCFFFTACGGSDSGQTPGATIDKSQQTFKWKMVTTWPANFPIFQEGAEKFAADVKIMSQGRLDIHVYAGGELVPPLQVFDAVSQGTIEMGLG